MAAAKRTIIALFGTILFFIITPIQFAHQCWQYLLNQDTAISLISAKEVYANVLVSVEEALKALLPEAQEIEKETKNLTDDQITAIEEKADLHLNRVYDKKFQFFIGRKGGDVIGYAVQDAVPGKWGPIYYMVAFDPVGRVKDVMVLAYEEKRGRPIAKRRFLKQFIGKETSDDIKFMRDIRGVTGASISSRGMADGVRKLTHVFEVLYGGN